MFKEICSEQRQWRRSDVFTACSSVSIVNFEHVIADWEFINNQQILHIVVVFQNHILQLCPRMKQVTMKIWLILSKMKFFTILRNIALRTANVNYHEASFMQLPNRLIVSIL